MHVFDTCIAAVATIRLPAIWMIVPDVLMARLVGSYYEAATIPDHLAKTIAQVLICLRTCMSVVTARTDKPVRFQTPFIKSVPVSDSFTAAHA